MRKTLALVTLTLNDKSIRNTNRDKIVFFDGEVEQQIYQIVDNAKRSVTLVTPYLQLWRHLQMKIEEAISRRVEVRFVLRTDWDKNEWNAQGKKSKNEEDLNWLFDQKVKVYKRDGLHAKIYINESEVLISSMNVTKSSTNESLEFAMLIINHSDMVLFRDYVTGLIKKAELINPPTGQFRNKVTELIKNVSLISSTTEYAPLHASKVSERSKRDVTGGNCIRCGNGIAFNEDKPLCPDCFRKWTKYENPDFKEKHCHQCGNPSSVTFRKPLCERCYRS